MGDKSVTADYDDNQMRAFSLAVLNDLQAFQKMLDTDMFDEDVRRIGAEQEMFLVDSAMRPAPIAVEVIEEAKDGRLTTEIGRFNLEANLTPREFTGNCLGQMERELHQITDVVRRATAKFNSDTVLAGILPTIQVSDLSAGNLTPDPRYEEINRVVTRLHGDGRVIHIKGLDELQLMLQDTFIEFSNTSFQIHFQTGISEFVKHYNWAQAIAAPVLASAVNAPLLLNHRLWHETRIALFQMATDTRSLTLQERNQPPRVNFGDRWVESSILEVLREDAVRFRVLLTQKIEENSLESVLHGNIPRLAAWRLHNGTIWRWNRPCYGIINGKPGLRIEARFLPAGPSLVDEMANTAFFLGLLVGLPEELGDVTKLMPFDLVKSNFFNVARYGICSQITWLDGKSWRAGRLIREQLLPVAYEGLRHAGIDEVDIERLLRIIDERVQAENTGAAWMIQSLAAMDPRAKANVRMRTLTAAMIKNQKQDIPVHEWKLADIPMGSEWIDNYKTVEPFMTTDLFTVHPEDVVDLAASLMHWRHIRHVPVEDDEGRLIGILSHRDLLRLVVRGELNNSKELAIRDVMKTELFTISPETPTLEALRLMRENNIGCLPVVRNERLLGLVTAYDFLTVSAKLLEEKLRETIAAEESRKSSPRNLSKVQGGSQK